MMNVLTLLLVVAVLGTGTEGKRGNNHVDRTKVVGGTETTISKHPHQLSLMYMNQHICGASIISEKWALTAAHCIEDRAAADMTVRCGSSVVDVGGTIRQVKFAYSHPGYDHVLINDNSMDYDLALLEMVEEFPISDLCKPIEITDNNDTIPEGTKAEVTGWGKISESSDVMAKFLRVVVVQILDRRYCQRMYVSMNITERMLCAGYRHGGKDACQGDSGGPLVVDGKLTGIVSWGWGCARSNAPGVYSNIAAMRDFITSRDQLTQTTGGADNLYNYFLPGYFYLLFYFLK